MAKYTYLSQEAYDKLCAEVDLLKTEGRAKASKDIAEAREKGDLSENAEYDAAKDAQGLLELKINQLSGILANARVMDMDTIDTSTASVFTTVVIKNIATKKKFKYTLVSETEADLKKKKISVTSPIGKGLLGKKVGEIANVHTPRGIMKFEIMDISLE